MTQQLRPELLETLRQIDTPTLANAIEATRLQSSETALRLAGAAEALQEAMAAAGWPRTSEALRQVREIRHRIKDKLGRALLSERRHRQQRETCDHQ